MHLYIMCPTNTDFTYSHGAAPLRATNSFIYLGVCVCSSLSFNNHINNTIRKANSTLFMLMHALKGGILLCQENRLLQCLLTINGICIRDLESRSRISYSVSQIQIMSYVFCFINYFLCWYYWFILVYHC